MFLMLSMNTSLSASASSDAAPTTNIEVVEVKNKAFRLDPAFPVTALSMTMNFALGNMLVYGLTGKSKLAYVCGLLTMPPTLFFCLRDAQRDFDNWEKTRYYRERNYPAGMLPIKVRYDWSNYEDVMMATRERKLEWEREANNREYERERQ